MCCVVIGEPDDHIFVICQSNATLPILPVMMGVPLFNLYLVHKEHSNSHFSDTATAIHLVWNEKNLPECSIST